MKISLRVSAYKNSGADSDDKTIDAHVQEAERLQSDPKDNTVDRDGLTAIRDTSDVSTNSSIEERLDGKGTSLWMNIMNISVLNTSDISTSTFATSVNPPNSPSDECSLGEGNFFEQKAPPTMEDFSSLDDYSWPVMLDGRFFRPEEGLDHGMALQQCAD